jgi:hypothetical protein
MTGTKCEIRLWHGTFIMATKENKAEDKPLSVAMSLI